MRLKDKDGAVWIIPEEGFTPIAGPFQSSAAARGWIIEKVESQLNPEKLDIWRRVSAANPPSSDMGRELFLVTAVAKGKTFEQIAKYIPGSRAHTQEAA